MKSIYYHISIRMKSLLFGLILFSSVFASTTNAQTITLQSPNGGETWAYGSYETATWTGQNLSGTVTIEFSYDGGINWWYFGEVSCGPNGGSSMVSPPNINTTSALLRITDYTHPDVSDVSDAPFTNFVPPIVIFQPYAGQAIFVDNQVYIYWMLNVNGVYWLNAEISLDNGQTFTLLAENINAGNAGTTYLTLSDTPADSCILKLYDAENPEIVGLSDVFAISPVPLYTITSPAEGEVVNSMSQYTINWNVENPYSQNCYLEYSLDNGMHWTVIDNAVNVGNSGSYEWVTPNANSDECMVRIQDGYAPAVDFSDVFSILTFPETPVCMVTVDSLTNFNAVVWEKPVTELIADFLVYKETDQSDVYEVIDTVGYDEASMVTDFGSNPAMRPYRYKIGFLDNENREFPAGDYHQTIHLTINQGVNGNWNLIWTPYYGFDYTSYYIMRKSGEGLYEEIATVSASFNSYSDFDAPSGDVSYMIKIIHPTGCDYLMRENGIPEVYSNVASNSVVDVSETEDFDFSVYPNPASDHINVIFSDKIKDQIHVYITDLSGRKIYSESFDGINSGQIQSISTRQFEEGMYLLHLQSGENQRTRKIMVRHF